MVEDGLCEIDVHRLNEGYKASGAFKSVLNNKGLCINAKKCPYEGGDCANIRQDE